VTWRGTVVSVLHHDGFDTLAANGENLVVLRGGRVQYSDLRAPARRAETVTLGNDRFVALASGGRALVSFDGEAWIEGIPSAAVDTRWDVICAGGQFVAVGSNGTMPTSEDGKLWTPRDSGTDRFLRSAAYGNGRYVVV